MVVKFLHIAAKKTSWALGIEADLAEFLNLLEFQELYKKMKDWSWTHSIQWICVHMETGCGGEGLWDYFFEAKKKSIQIPCKKSSNFLHSHI